ncbi:site-specific integrase [Actinomadura sp. GC306]|uniref:tyrosine-type recombinase/integrase n=1 Tax=Actinomadura sp. GC306 TaxID=2530367 RepID=UPI00104EEBAF|nr:site-specific integrase [Actinomadura sp. GC306]TDC69987.1 site-specific integrase [Actinomadura sp. GC306]
MIDSAKTITGAAVSLKDAAEAFLGRRDLDGDTIRSYAQTIRWLLREFGEDVPLQWMTAERIAVVFTAAWDEAAARTWNRHRAALRSLTVWAVRRGWYTGDLAACIERRPEPRGRTRVIDRRIIAALLENGDVPQRERVLWRLLYESAARADLVLSLDVEDLDLAGNRGRVTKDGVERWLRWQSGTTHRLAELVEGRARGPVFLTDRRPAPARMPDPGDLCPVTGRGRLSYERAEYLFKQVTKRIDPEGHGYTLHQLRHSRLTHLGEDGWTGPMLMALSGHDDVRSLAGYVDPRPPADPAWEDGTERGRHGLAL